MSEEQELMASAGYIATDVASKVKDLTDAQLLQQPPAELPACTTAVRWQYVLSRAFLRVNGQRSRLSNERDLLQQLVDSAARTDEERLAKIRELELALEEARRVTGLTNDGITELTRRGTVISDLEAWPAALTRRAEAAEKERDQWKADHDALDATNASLRRSLTAVTENLKESEAECERLKADLATLRGTITEQSSRIRELLRVDATEDEQVVHFRDGAKTTHAPGKQTFKHSLSADDVDRIEHAILHWEEGDVDCSALRSLIRGTLPAGYGVTVDSEMTRLSTPPFNRRSRALDLLQTVTRTYTVWDYNTGRK